MKLTALLLAVGLIAGCGSGRDEVTAIEKNKTYHRSDCRRVMMADTKTMTHGEALKMDFRPCPYCRPDISK